MPAPARPTFVSALAPARRTFLAHTATDAVRAAILAGKFVAGDSIAQRDVARQLGVSQGPAREALAALEHEGLVQRTPTNRLVVTRLDPEDVRDVVEVRTALEILTVQLASRNGTEEDFERLAKNVAETKSAPDAEALIARDVEFHELLIRAGRNRRLLALWRLIMRRMLASPENNARTAARAHAGLLALIRAREETRAVRFVEAQMETLLEVALRLGEPAEGRRQKP